LLSTAIPLTMLAAAWGALIWLRILPQQAMDGGAYAAMALAALACWRFRRSRALVPLAYLALCLWFTSFYATLSWAGQLGQIVYPALALLLPLNWTVAVLAGDRGCFSRVPLALLGVAALLVLVVLFVATGAFGAYDPLHADAMQALVADVLHMRLLPLPLGILTPLPPLALLVGLVCVLGLVARASFIDSPMDAGLGIALAGAMGVLHFAGSGPQASAMALGAALAAAVPLVQDSYRMAFLDELTGLPGRRSLMADMRALGGSFAIAMADVDHFKKFNDTYGHDIGDEVLRMVASHLGRVGGGGRAYRYGGEEFTILFPRSNAQDSLASLDAVREAIANAAFTLRKSQPKAGGGGAKGGGAAGKGSKKAKAPKASTVSVTISMGVAEPGSGGAAAPEEVLKNADKALYKAKKKGRNRVEKN